ncbi:5-oxoprolinase subunit PxpB [Sporosarcina sp.]|uniref:5-oxoprolinase subunit PxpB n=1 Tax=Sporosarcina sp. TaxID=49982 RepID=UPI002634B320|nr:5-oxoprolinase subunit PxpB [Sporosarcina sp.]
MQFDCRPAGDCAVLVSFEQKISEDINENVIRLAECIHQAGIHGVEELVPAFATVMIYYNPLHITCSELIKRIHLIDVSSVSQKKKKMVVHDIPVLYGGDAGPDLAFIAEYHHLIEQEVIRIHTEEIYRVYMIGFVPGFPYLGGLDSRIHTPRLESPRLQTPAGSVGIAGQQTGIYPLTTPGGWRIIGRTPAPLFKPEETERPVLISPGDAIRFIPITEERYSELMHEDTPQYKGGSY